MGLHSKYQRDNMLPPWDNRKGMRSRGGRSKLNLGVVCQVREEAACGIRRPVEQDIKETASGQSRSKYSRNEPGARAAQQEYEAA